MHKFLKLWFGLSSCSWDLELFYFKPVLYEFTYTNDVYNIYFYTILINYYKFLLQFKTCSCLWVGVKTRKFNISNSNKEGGIYDTVQVDCVSFSHEGVMIRLRENLWQSVGMVLQLLQWKRLLYGAYFVIYLKAWWHSPKDKNFGPKIRRA